MDRLDNKTKRVETVYGSFFSWKDDVITDQLERYSGHTRNELSMLRSIILEGDNIIDIGAHIGTFSIPFAVFNQKKGMIYSFEANPNNYRLLVENIQANNLDTVIIPSHAVVSVEENKEFSISLPDRGNTGMYYFTAIAENSESTVTSINIDKWHDRQNNDKQIHLIKIDVEGAELQVLQSCQKTIQEYRPALYIEINTHALQRFGTTCQDLENVLSPLGYHFFRNIGSRNSDNDTFKIALLKTIEDGGDFFDLLAVHPSDTRYPKQYLGSFSLYFFRIKSNLLDLTKRFTKRLFRFA